MQANGLGGINLKSNIMNFENFYWHDAVIKNITINRDNPGIKDEIIFEIIWPDNDERVNFVFEDVFWAKMNLNFGIVANETILQGYLLPNSDEDLINFYSLWKDARDKVKLNVYLIELNSTGGTIKIIAKSFRVDKLC
jgi:hypothetical protein